VYGSGRSARAAKHLFVSAPAIHNAAGRRGVHWLIVLYMKMHEICCVGGLELGAVPVVSAVAAVSHLKGFPIDAFFVRKAQKEHGARETMDGHLRDGAEVLMVDDVATTGGSILKAIEGMEGHGAYVRRALVVVDREEGAVQNLAAQGINLAAFFKRSGFPEILSRPGDKA
jgi:orotate phosphoribosyltransferase